MPSWFDSLLLGASLFVATNLDDLVLLLVWFADRRLSALSIVLGQLAGILLLTLGSILLALGSRAIPPHWLAPLGLMPLGLGLRALRAASRSPQGGRESGESPPLRPGNLCLAVTLVTLANGSDNVAVYVPGLAQAFPNPAAILPIFSAGTLLWCLLAWWLTRRTAATPRWQAALARSQPWVLIAVGIWILWDIQWFWSSPSQLEFQRLR